MNYGQTVADGAMLLIYFRCEVMSDLSVVCYYFPPANLTLAPHRMQMHQHIQWIHIVFAR